MKNRSKHGALAAILSAILMLPSVGHAQLPLQPERKIEFQTDEGTWISLDVSPDGRTVVFDLLGQLYTVAIGGGEARPITSGMAFNSQPRFSRDGRQIIYISDRGGAENVWISSADGSNARQISQDRQAEFASPIWLEDGKQVLVSRRKLDGAFELWQYNVDGGSGVQVTEATEDKKAPSTEEANAIGATASADGKYIYYARRGADFDFTPEYQDFIPKSQIMRIDRTTGEEAQITQSIGAAFRPQISPDGTMLAYGTRQGAQTGLKMIDLRTRDERWLKLPVQPDDMESEYGSAFNRDILPGYAFTPDSREVVLTYGGKIHRIDVASGQETEVPFAARVSQDIGPLLSFPTRVEQGPVKWRVFQGASQAPDGGKLAFSAATHIYTADLGGTPKRLTSSGDNEFQPIWSPDGRWIAYVTWSTNGGQVWKVRSEGGKPVQISRVPAYYRDLAWSPDGATIVALRGPRQWQLDKPSEFLVGRELLELIALPAAGGEAKAIGSVENAQRPHFVASQPDRVYVSTTAGLVSMRLDGADKRTHINILLNGEPKMQDTGGAEVQISPDGRWIAARSANIAYLFPAPALGGKPVDVDLAPGAWSKTSIPVRRLSGLAADSIDWSGDGTTIVWTVGATFFRQPVSAAWSDLGKPEEIAVNLEFPRATPRGTILLRGARTITMRGDEIIEDSDILVRDNRISKVGPSGSFDVPADAHIVDVAGKTIVPGFFDLHAHWTNIRRGVLDPANNWNFAANLAYGVTTGRDVQTLTFDTLAYQDLVDMGQEVGPRTYSTGPGVFWTTDFQSYEQARDYLAAYKKNYRLNYIKAYLTGNRQQRQWLIQASKELGLMPTTEGHSDTELDLTHILDGFAGLEHSMPTTPLFKDVVEAMVQSKVTYTPTLVVSYGGPLSEDYFYETTEVQNDPKLRHFVPNHILDAMTRRRPVWSSENEYVFKRLATEDKKLVDAGARVAVGSHGQLQGIAYHWELWLLASGGMTPLEVLRAATMHGAEGLGLEQDLGSIEEGKLADLVVLAKNPIDDIRNTNSIVEVMKNGVLYDGNTLDEMADGGRKQPKAWWVDDLPNEIKGATAQ